MLDGGSEEFVVVFERSEGASVGEEGRAMEIASFFAIEGFCDHVTTTEGEGEDGVGCGDKDVSRFTLFVEEDARDRVLVV